MKAFLVQMLSVLLRKNTNHERKTENNVFMVMENLGKICFPKSHKKLIKISWRVVENRTMIIIWGLKQEQKF